MNRPFLVAVALTATVPFVAHAAKGKDAKVASSATGASANAKAAASAAAAAAPAAAAPRASTYEELRARAEPAGDLGNLVEPLFAGCSTGNDLIHRQCDRIRQWHLGRLKERTWYAMADLSALQQQPYDSASKTLTLTVNGCIQCTRPPVVAGAPRLIATGAPKGMDEGAPVGLDVATHDMPFPSADKAKFWTDKVRPRLRVEFLFSVAQPFEAQAGRGVAVRLLGHRIFNQCTGEVLASQPPSTEAMKIANRPASCPAADAPTDEELRDRELQSKLPDTISRMQVLKILAPIQQGFYDCAETFELKQGVAKVHVGVGPDGKAKITIGEPYNKGDVALCFRAALNEVKFPSFKRKSPPVEIDYPFVLRR